MGTPEVVILIGLQGSGKSTFYREHFARTHRHVSKDNFRHARRRHERQQQLIETALRAGYSVVVDNTNPTIADRADVILLAKSLGARVVGYYFLPNVPASLARNAQRQGRDRVPDRAIFIAAARLQPPSFGEGYDALYEIRLNTEGRVCVVPASANHFPDQPA